MVRRQDEEWSVFWCSLLQPVFFGDIDPADKQRFLNEVAQREYLFPNGVRKNPSLSTLQRKLRQYRRAGDANERRKTEKRLATI